MFDLFSSSHLLILLIVALVVVGPKDLPKLLHMMGKWAGKARAMASEFRKSFDEMARQTELDELRKEIEALKKNNPVSEFQNTMSDMQNKMNDPLGEEMDGAGQAAPDQAAPETSAPLEDDPEPRAGEFDVTQAAAAPVQDDEPMAEPAPVRNVSQA